MKAGWKTSEFWLTVVSSVLAVMVVAGAVKPDESATLSQAVQTAITAVGVVVSNAAIVWNYIKSRTDAKANDVAAEVQKLHMMSNQE